MRLHFTPADLRQISFAPVPNALLESLLSVYGLHAKRYDTPPQPDVREWRRRMNSGLADRAGVLSDLAGAAAFLPDFLFQPDAADLATGVELAVRTPASQLAADLAPLPPPSSPGVDRWRRELSAGAAEARRRLASDLHRYFDSSLEPLWPRMRAAATVDRALRAETLLRGGVDALLTTLGTRWQWRPPVLHLPMSGDHDVELCGHGLLLFPSYFARSCALMDRPGQSAVLVYPMHRGDAPVGATDALGPLVGRTRAEILAVLRAPATTTAVAEKVGVSWPPPASTPPCCVTPDSSRPPAWAVPCCTC